MAVTTDRAARRRPRRDGDALPRASVGTVPILWYKADSATEWDGQAILDEIARLGFEGTQLGQDFPAGTALRDELSRRDLRLAEVYAALPATVDGLSDGALAVARACLTRLHDAGGDVLCVAIDGSPDRDAVAGRADRPGTPAFTDAAWGGMADALDEIAEDAADMGHATVFHPHAGTYIETPAEVERLLASTDPERVGVGLDTGHQLFAGADPVADLRRLGERVRHVHLKDVDPVVLSGLRGGRYHGLADAVRHGLFTELGAGVLDLDGVLQTLAGRDYDGWLMVEQDRSGGPPSEAAAIGMRALARSLGRLGRGGMTEGPGTRTVA
jgi:inosose dehydratase